VHWAAFRIGDVLRRELTMLIMILVQGQTNGFELVPASVQPYGFPVTMYHAAAEEEKKTARCNQCHAIGGIPNPESLNGKEGNRNSPHSERGQRESDYRKEQQQLHQAKLHG
jgi:hypothetical protein